MPLPQIQQQARSKKKTGVQVGERRADILITNIGEGGTIIDVVISQPNVTFQPNAATVANKANDKARIEKVNDYQKNIMLSRHANLIIAAFEVGGRPDPSWSSWLHSYFKKRYPHKDECAIQLNRAKQSISVHLRRSIAMQYLTMMKQHSESAIFDIVDGPQAPMAAASAVVLALDPPRECAPPRARGRPPGSRSIAKPRALDLAPADAPPPQASARRGPGRPPGSRNKAKPSAAAGLIASIASSEIVNVANASAPAAADLS